MTGNWIEQYRYTYTPVCIQKDGDSVADTNYTDDDIYTIYSGFNYSGGVDYKYYYHRGEGSLYNYDDANNGITTCNTLTEPYKTEIINAVKSAVVKLNDIENSLSTQEVKEAWKSEELTEIPNIYDEQFYVNLGLKQREEFDLTVAKDIYSATVTINGKTTTYNYNNIELTNDASNWIATVRQSDINYERNIYSSDYMSIKNTLNPKDVDVTVKYRIALKNQTANIVGKITELIDYYDKDYKYIENSIYIADGGNSEESKNTNIIFETEKDRSVYKNADQNSSELNVGYIIPTDNFGNYITMDINNTEDKFIYLEFSVEKSSNLLLVDGQITAEGLKEELNRPKTNIVEINGYKTEYAEGYNSNYAFGTIKRGMIAGLMDEDSSPGNYSPDDNYDDNTNKYKVYEDDEAVAGGLYLYVNYKDRRTITGTVWEDEALATLLQDNIRQGDGRLNDIEKLVQNVKVELVNDAGHTQNYYDVYLEDWKPAIAYTDSEGNYKIENFIPGNYKVKFTYNNNSTNMKIGEKSSYTTHYNGQDYKSTMYAREDESDKLWYVNENIEDRKSDAKDIWERREEVNNYSRTLTNDIAESLIPTDSSKYALEETEMSALTPEMNIKVEYNKDIIQSEINKSLGQSNSDDTTAYLIENIDFGLVERPRAQLSIQKNVANVKVILADGTVLFDAIPNAEGKFEGYTNLGSIARKLATAYVETKEESGVTKLKNSTHVSTEQGRITMNMDEELMQGANLQVTYEIEVKNKGERDYNTEEFYNYGTIDESAIVTTKVDQIIDYVENNMKFNNKLNNIDINKGWEVKTQSDIDTSGTDVVLKDTVIEALFNKNTDVTDDAYNTIAVLTGETDAKEGSAFGVDDKLRPDETAKSDFILTQLISPDNDNDDLTYKNVLEIIKTTNDVGRRMYFSIAGNHVPVKREEANPSKILKTSLRPEGREIDTDDGELITIIPPFGANMQKNSNYAIFAVALVAFFGIGVYLIKKKVLK